MATQRAPVLTFYSLALYEVEVVAPVENTGAETSHQALEVAIVNVENVLSHLPLKTVTVIESYD